MRPGRREPCRALLIDLDGVLRRFDPARIAALEARHGLPDGLLAGTAFAPDRLRDVVLGRTTHDAWVADVAGVLGQALDDTDRAGRAVDAWASYRGEVVPETLAAVRELRAAGTPVALGTNATDRLAADLAALGLAGEFDAVVNSSVLGHAKPSADFYAAGCEALGVAARHCLFVDDSDRNVRGARLAGLAAVRYTGPSDLRYVRAALDTAAA